ncbi:thiosulfate sulfurtransferase (rhodanese)-like domain-containing protein 2 [Balamuthia mandrillaris]
MKATTPTLEEEGGGGLILLFYKYVDVDDPQGIAGWQQKLCERLDIAGKIRVAKEGINGTVGGACAAIEEYQREMHGHPLFHDIEFKRSAGSAAHFEGVLSVRVVEEIITLGISPEKISFHEAGPHLTPQEFHQTIEESSPEELLLLDCRNDYESRIGKFNNALAVPIRKFSSFPGWVDENLSLLQDKKILMYCTGGIRCERASAYLRNKGLEQVYQLHGGIHKYIETYPNGHFRGKNYVFDGRQAMPANSDVLGRCSLCERPFDEYAYCSSTDCRVLVLACPTCHAEKEKDEGGVYCCEECKRYGGKWTKHTRKKQREMGTSRRARKRKAKKMLKQKEVRNTEEEEEQEPDREQKEREAEGTEVEVDNFGLDSLLHGEEEEFTT